MSEPPGSDHADAQPLVTVLTPTDNEAAPAFVSAITGAPSRLRAAARILWFLANR